MSKKRSKIPYVTLLIGIIIGAFGVTIYVLYPKILNNLFEWQLKLEKGNHMYESWTKPPIEIDSKIYVFHVKNAVAFLNGTERPKLVERGPYVYRYFIC